MTTVARLLVTALLITSAAGSCSEGQLRCADCTTQAKCAAGELITAESCPSGSTCVEKYGTAFCTSSATTPCTCSPLGMGCDPYDPRALITCSSEGTVYKGRQCDAGEVCSAGSCVPDVLLDVKCPLGASSSLQYPSCTTGYVCAEGAVVQTYACKGGEYFDVEEWRCREYPPNSCGNDYGFYPVATDCRKAVLCLDGEALEEITCDEGKYFNINRTACEPAEGLDLPCALYAQCDFTLMEQGQFSTTLDYQAVSTTPATTTTATTTSTTTRATTTTQGGQDSGEPEAKGVYNFLLSITSHVATSLLLLWSRPAGNLTNSRPPLRFPGSNASGYPGVNPGFFGDNPDGYPGRHPVGYPIGDPIGYPGEYPGRYPGGYRQLAQDALGPQ